MMFGVGWMLALATVGMAYSVSLWAAFVFAAIVSLFVLYAWATK